MLCNEDGVFDSKLLGRRQDSGRRVRLVLAAKVRRCQISVAVVGGGRRVRMHRCRVLCHEARARGHSAGTVHTASGGESLSHSG